MTGTPMTESRGEVLGQKAPRLRAIRLGSASAIAALTLMATSVAEADIVRLFDLSGTLQIPVVTLTGTIDLDFTDNTVESVDVTVEGLPAYNQSPSMRFGVSGSPAVVDVFNSSGDMLSLLFNIPNPRTLAGFDGGALIVEGTFAGASGLPFMFGSNALITRDPGDPPDPATGASVPEPSTWALMLLGFAGLGAAEYGRRAIGFLARKA
jgi:PEP-CTERM motif